MKGCFTIAAIVLFSCHAWGQKYNFVNWTVEDGLIQSQASSICQDKYRQLWIGTEGGVSKFDGKKFTGYAAQDGLIANPVSTLFCDNSGNIWIGTNYGLSLFNGRTFHNIKLNGSAVNNITSIVQSEEGTIYTLANFKLYGIFKGVVKKIAITGDSTERVTALYYSHTDQVMVFISGKGLYVNDKTKWQLCVPAREILKNKSAYHIFISSNHDTLLTTRAGLYQIKNNIINEFQIKGKTLFETSIFCIAEDSRKNIWIGTDHGMYKFDHVSLSHFDAKNGFTDNSVNCIYNDAENNLWFATDADGIYKFRENTFTYYDKSSGFSNTIIMGVTQSIDGSIYAGGYGGGLYKLNSQKNVEPVGNAKDLINAKINCIYADNQNNLWIGTIGKGAWEYNTKKGLKRIVSKAHTDLIIRGATSFLKDNNGNMLIGGNEGLFVFDKNENLSKIKMDQAVVTSLKIFDGDSILVGTLKGVYTLNNHYETKPIKLKELVNAPVLCIAKNNDHVWIGTMDKGVLNWNSKTGKIITYNASNGLPSNFIYSIEVSQKQKAWIGTGFGISNLQIDDDNHVVAIKNYGQSDGLLGMECSHNCVLKSSDLSLWFGTTKGLFHFNPDTNITEKNQPLVLLKSVKLFSSDITDSSLYQKRSDWFSIPEQLKLKSSQNHLTFELGAIYFTNPEDLLFKYKLDGIDKDFTISSNPVIIYPALPPGQYTLKVFALTKNGLASVNNVNYSFQIKQAFYQSRVFQILVVLLLITTGALMAYLFSRRRQKRKQKAKETLEKIREEEFMKLRQRTAEDFHDEMGNSLTRISVLTDVLKSKIKQGEPEITKLVNQIKENTATLYNGSRDIIWSLNSQNDGMYEIAEHIKQIGVELFGETEIEFTYSHNIKAGDHDKLKLDYSRNLTMIFKEAFNNILKHAEAGKAQVTLFLDQDKTLEVTITDNGKGFVILNAECGNGIKNMTNRVKRLNGEINIESAVHKGTDIKIILKNIFS